MRRDDDWLIPYHLRTVRALVRASALSVGFLVLSLLLPQARGSPKGPLVTLIAAGAVAGVVIALLPWDRMLRSRSGLQWLYAWTAFYILLISVAIWVTGSAASELFYLYGLTTVFLAVSFRPRGQGILLAFTATCYVAVLAATGWRVSPALLVLRLAILAILGFLAGYLSRELTRHMEAYRAARDESRRRATLLAKVAGAARTMSTLDPGQVLRDVVGCALELGFQAANLCLYDEERERYRVAYARGLPAEYVRNEHPWDIGMPGLVRVKRKTVALHDYASSPHAVPQLAAAGFRAVVASPVWSQGQLVGALVAGTRQRRHLTESDVEAFELLAAQASRALENAHRFESERRAVERLAELDRLKRDFLSTVSHELRTPLTAIEGLGLTLERQWPSMDDDIRLDLLRRLNANANALDGIIRTLLDFSRLESGRLEANVQQVDLRTLVEGVITRLNGMLDGHRLVVRLEEGLLVEADPMLLDRVAENLLTNAAKHTAAGTRVILSTRAVGEDAVVSLTDDGPGIPEEELKHIGTRFYRGSNTAMLQIRGMGLGLALVSEILELHGSRLEVESQIGRGSRFSFRLPLAPGARPSSAQATGDGETAQGPPGPGEEAPAGPEGRPAPARRPARPGRPRA